MFKCKEKAVSIIEQTADRDHADDHNDDENDDNLLSSNQAV